MRACVRALYPGRREGIGTSVMVICEGPLLIMARFLVKVEGEGEGADMVVD